jgi:hypothetical protein
MLEAPKPPELAQRGGSWVASGSVQLHLEVENGFRSRSRHTPPSAAVTMRLS